MSLVETIQDVTDHIKAYLLAGTLVALGADIARNVSGSVGGAMTGAMATAMPAAPNLMLSDPATLAVQGIGALIGLVGAVLYLGNMWCGFVALRQFRFNFAERGVLLQACGWSAAFLYVVVSAVIGVAVNAVYLALVG
ncbi:MAG: hypothetical protein AAF390_16130 [Pseudomonadota bacterium]